MPKISVIMPVYNTEEEYLREAIESILNQTYKDFEFIIVNDGSTNNAEDVILSYKDERIRYHFQENQGIATALNNGFDMAQGEYIARMDSDDISLPDRFAKQVEFLDNHPDISVLGTWAKFFPAKKNSVIDHPEFPCYIDFILSCKIVHPSAMLRKKSFDMYNLRYNKEFNSAEDYELWSRAIGYLKFANLQEVLLNYRWHESNTCKVSRKKQISLSNKIVENMLNFLTKDTKAQEKILDIAFNQRKLKFMEKIFSVRNEYNKKAVRILGFKIKIPRKL